MNELEKLLNQPEGPKPTDTAIPKVIEKPTAAAMKASTLSDQDQAIAAASVGSSVYRSAATYLAANSVIKVIA